MNQDVIERVASAEIARLNRECEVLRMQIGYLATLLMVRGDKRTMPEIVDEAAEACSPKAPQ